MITNTLFDASPRSLKLLAALVWYSGFVVLYIKSAMLITEADRINTGQIWTWLAILAGFIIGGIKAKYLYRRLCIKNLKRINALKQAKIWHFYRMRFFIFLFSMIALGLFLSQWVDGNYSMLLTLALIEISVATGLLGSSHCFWKKTY